MKVKQLGKQANSKETILKGTPVSRGVVIGRAFFFTQTDSPLPEFRVEEDQVEREVGRYKSALEATACDIRILQGQLRSEKIVEGAEILEAHLLIMRDPLLTDVVESEIHHSRRNAEAVFSTLIKDVQQKFCEFKDPFFRERFKDIQDISQRVIAHLRRSVRVSLRELPEGSILFISDLSVSDVSEAGNGNVYGLVTRHGSIASHAAIVAKAKGIPYVSGIDFEEFKGYHGAVVIVDGRKGCVIVNPSSETLDQYRLLASCLDNHREILNKLKPLPAETVDGYSIRLSANIEVSTDLDMMHSFGGQGVGLFRSEYICMNLKEFPSEEAQYEIYTQIVQNLKGLPIVIRTFDLGGDKIFKGHSDKEGASYLGCRALRFLLKERDIFKEQLRAILRAAALGEVSILFPMVSALSELREAKLLIKEVCHELAKKKIPHNDSIRIGCMIEVPSAAIIADILARECDFLSIGTNDLVQYSLAVDRRDEDLQHYYTPTHPSVIRLIKLVVSEANNRGIPVSVCGEIASDPRFTPLLLGLGVHELSLAARYLPVVKQAVRSWTILSAVELAEEVLSLTSAEEIASLLDRNYQLNSPQDSLYNYSI